MKQYKAVIKVMEENGGYATLGHLYQNVLKVEGCEWKTKTPFASMRRIVQDNRFFFKIKPGLWALKSHRHLLPAEMIPTKKDSRVQRDFSHAYYQGLLVQIGNLRHLSIPKTRTEFSSEKTVWVVWHLLKRYIRFVTRM